MEPTKPKILIVARDAGAANALAPVAHALIADDCVTAVMVGLRYAESVFRQHELPLWAVEDDGADPGVAARLLERERPSFLLTGTSMKPQRDGRFWSAAQALGIPSMAVLDHWSNYGERFSSEGPFSCMPDQIAVMDATARDKMIDAGCPPERLVVTGQPYFDDFDNVNPRAECQLRALARRQLDVLEGEQLLVFASEPQAKYYGADAASSGWLGYTEHDALRVLLEALHRLRGAPPQVIVKLHPIEEEGPITRLQQGVRLRTLRHFPPQKLIAAADVIVGMTSIFLLEAALMGKPAISLQPGRIKPDTFNTNHAGLIEQAGNIDECQAKLTEAFASQATARQRRRQRAVERGFDGRAGRRITGLIYEKIGLL